MIRLLFVLHAVLLGVLMSFSLKAGNEGEEKNTFSQTNLPGWLERISIRGYTQIRYNRLFETNPNLRCEQCDRSWGENGGFFMRRMRIIFSGQLSERVSYYIQPDFASNASSTGLHFAQMRDVYMDLGLDKKNAFRFRVGQSKIPFGFENMQSSQQRLALDRNDALNSAFTNERDLGVFFYWAPEKARQLLSDLVKDGLKGSGDYGIVGLGVFNGQTANRPELNDNKHFVCRLTAPFALGKQLFEVSMQGYTGQFVLPSSQISQGVRTSPDRSYLDQRTALTFVMYPKPFGIQAEYNVGRGPQYNKHTQSIEVMSLHGGYVCFSYRKVVDKQCFMPFVRGQYYDGGKKHELDARSYLVKELELGLEWQASRAFELVAMYTFSDRKFEDHQLPNNRQSGRLLRLQAQLNF